MLKELSIRNLILIDKMEISFHEAFNVVSGETGAGKSAIMTAINLILGERAEGSLLRHGEEKGSIEALFYLENSPSLFELLDEAGIEVEDGEIILRREIRVGGKSRSFINSCSVPLQLLKSVGKFLVKFVDQHAAQELLTCDAHRSLLDSYAELDETLKAFKMFWRKEKELQNEIEQLHAGETRRRRELEILQQEAQEIDQAALVEGEEESLFHEYTKLTHVEELKQKKDQLANILEGEGKSVLNQLRTASKILGEAAEIDSALGELSGALQQAFLEIKEVSYGIYAAGDNGEVNPYRIAEIDERLALINKLKKRYGPELRQVLSYREEIRGTLEVLENSENRIEELQKQCEEAKLEADRLAAILSERRKQAAAVMAKKVEEHLHRLNMSKARFEVRIENQERTSSGDDQVEFFLSPNVGEEAVSVRQAASGGEISRLMLALQTLLAGKEKIPTLLFDEIDANVGGKTATAVGEKLNAIAQEHQVICITHFPQVAQKASYHLQISKEEIEGRTLTMMRALQGRARERELARMRGE